MGHVQKRTKNSWTLYYDLPRGRDGKRRQKTATVRGSRKDAERELKRIEYELLAGTHIEPNLLTLEAYLDQWFPTARTSVSAKTFQEYRRIATNHIIPTLGGIRLSVLSPLDIQAYYQELLKCGRLDGRGGLSGQTVLHHHRLLHRALQQAVSWRLITNNPVDAVSPPRIEKLEIVVLDEQQTLMLLEYARPTRLYVPVLLATTTGMRRGEILALRWDDLTPAHSTLAVRRSLEQVKDGLHFKPPKNGKGRLIRLPQITVEALRRHRIEQAERHLQLGPHYNDQSLICPRPDSTPWPPSNLSKLFCELAERHPDLPKIHFHSLRHGYATLSLGRGVHPKIVSEGLGHSGIAITLDLYSHAVPALRAEAASIFDDILQQDR